jgi:uncharacterized protein YndB with AHSA1/START domain
MAENTIHIDASPDEVFAFFADGCTYADWVVGAKKVRRSEEAWPAVGSRFHHSVGIGLLVLNDRTEVLELDAPKRLVLDARAFPLGRALVELVIEPDGMGTRVVMREHLLGVPAFVNRMVDPLVHVRNTESLRRLRTAVEGRVAQRA